jgi:hypothetical protein
MAHGTVRAPQSIECSGNSPTCELWVGVQCGVACSAAVNYEVVVLAAGNKGAITWKLDKGAIEAGFSFAKDAIGIDRKAFECGMLEEGRLFRCTKIRPGFGVFKYTVNVIGPRAVPPLDPWVVSEA